MNDEGATYNPPATLDATITQRAEWTPAQRDNGNAALILTATLAALEAAALLGATRAALALGSYDTTPTNAPSSDESEAA